MMRACQTQCSQCPFRRNSLPGWLGGYKEPHRVFSSMWKGGPFFCHTRTDYSKVDWKTIAMRQGLLCLGGLIFMHREIKHGAFPSPVHQAIQKALLVAMEKHDAHPEHFDVMRVNEFMAHHAKD